MGAVRGVPLGVARGHDPRRLAVGQGPQPRRNRPSPAYTSLAAMSFGPARAARIGPTSAAEALADSCTDRAMLRASLQQRALRVQQPLVPALRHRRGLQHPVLVPPTWGDGPDSARSVSTRQPVTLRPPRSTRPGARREEAVGDRDGTSDGDDGLAAQRDPGISATILTDRSGLPGPPSRPTSRSEATKPCTSVNYPALTPSQRSSTSTSPSWMARATRLALVRAGRPTFAYLMRTRSR